MCIQTMLEYHPVSTKYNPTAYLRSYTICDVLGLDQWEGSYRAISVKFGGAIMRQHYHRRNLARIVRRDIIESERIFAELLCVRFYLPAMADCNSVRFASGQLGNLA